MCTYVIAIRILLENDIIVSLIRKANKPIIIKNQNYFVRAENSITVIDVRRNAFIKQLIIILLIRDMPALVNSVDTDQIAFIEAN